MVASGYLLLIMVRVAEGYTKFPNLRSGLLRIWQGPCGDQMIATLRYEPMYLRAVLKMKSCAIINVLP